MNLQLDNNSRASKHEARSLWADNRVWWINSLAIERYWFYAGHDLQVARGRRDQMLTSFIENW